MMREPSYLYMNSLNKKIHNSYLHIHFSLNLSLQILHNILDKIFYLHDLLCEISLNYLFQILIRSRKHSGSFWILLGWKIQISLHYKDHTNLWDIYENILVSIILSRILLKMLKTNNLENGNINPYVLWKWWKLMVLWKDKIGIKVTNGIWKMNKMWYFCDPTIPWCGMNKHRKTLEF